MDWAIIAVFAAVIVALVFIIVVQDIVWTLRERDWLRGEIARRDLARSGKYW